MSCPQEQHPASAAHAFQSASIRAGSQPGVRHGTTCLTYSELAAAAGGIGTWLRTAGVGRGDVVATLLERSVWCPAAALGTWAAGAAYMHLEPADPAGRIAALLTATGARAVLVDGQNRGRLPVGAPPALVLDSQCLRAPYELLPEPVAMDTAYLVFTSGSAGTPKAVEVPHRALLNYCAGFRERIAPIAPSSFGITTTFASDLGNTCVYGALLHGARLDIYDWLTTLDAAALAADLRQHPVGCLKYTPTQFEALAADGGVGALLPTDLLVLGGEVFPPRLAQAITQARPGLAVYNHYGPSEATVGALMHRVVPGSRQGTVPVGTPLAGVVARLLAEDGERVPDGTPGVLHLGGPCLARGYLGDPGSAFGGFYTGPAGRFYNTGDLMITNAKGELEFFGRADRQLKIRGARIEPGEVEAALLAVPGVSRAVVTGERRAPQAPLELTAYVVAAASPPEIYRKLRDQLPSALIPGSIQVVPRIPVTPNGKADLRALRAMAATPGALTSSDPAGTPAEQAIAEAWCTALGRSVVGRNDKFVELGGDSFKCMLVFSQLRGRFPRLSIAQLYAHATIAELAAVLERQD